MEWQLGLRLGASQEQIKVDDDDFRTNTTLSGFNISALLLKEKLVSLRLFATSDDSIGERDFARNINIHNESVGFDFMLRGNFPAALRVEKLSSDETGDLRAINKESTHLNFTIADRRDINKLTTFTYDRLDQDEISLFTSTTGSSVLDQNFPILRDELNLSNSWKFPTGESELNHQLVGGIHIVDQRGFYPNSVFGVDQRLDLAHSRTLTSYYTGSFDIDETETEKDRRIFMEVGLVKKFYDSLDITLRGTGFDRNSDSGEEIITGASLLSVYRKQTPIGNFSTSFFLGRDNEREGSETGQTQIRDEEATLAGMGFSDNLEHANIIAGTIVVNPKPSTGRFIPYVKDIDYEIRTFGSFTQIRRLPGSDIADPEDVLVNYTAEVSRDATFDTDSLIWNNRLQLKNLPLTLYSDYSSRDEKLRSGTDPGNLDNERTSLLGAEVLYKDLTFTLEHETTDQELSPPTVSDRATISYSRLLRRNINLSLGMQAAKLQYQRAEQFGLLGDDSFLNTIGANVAIAAKLNPRTLVHFNSSYLRTTGQDDRAELRNTLSLEWRYGKLSFSINAHVDMFEQNSSDGNDVGVSFSLRRDL